MSGLEKLALAVQHNKGVYALLLGSGMSQSAQMPTGWDVTLQLVRRWAAACGEQITGKPDDWYRKKTGIEPNYSDVLLELANTPAERNALLRAYFTPSIEEQDQQVKVPQDGHRAIAELAAAGHVRVILTTNFDDLLEKALAQAGVDYQVIAKKADIVTVIPFVHAPCTVIKLHGDYRDAGIRNTVAELSSYDPEMKRLLKRVLDEYGLIVCGWSGDYDVALCSQLKYQAEKRRYSTYWTTRRPLRGIAADVAGVLSAGIVEIESADEFFRTLAETVKALEDTRDSAPLSARTAAALVRRYLVDDRYRIILSELVQKEARRVHTTTVWTTIHDAPAHMSTADLQEKLAFYQVESQTLMSMIATGCYWGESDHHRIWSKALRRLSHFNSLPGHRYDSIYYLQLLPSLFAMYAGGMASIAASDFDTLAALLLHESWPDPQTGSSVPLALHIIPNRVLDSALLKQIQDFDTWTPVSTCLGASAILRSATQDAWIDDDNFDDLFDWFEFFLGVVVLDLGMNVLDRKVVYRGRFIYRNNPSHDLRTMPVNQRFIEEYQTLGDRWPPLLAGFFGRSAERAVQAYQEYARFINGFR